MVLPTLCAINDIKEDMSAGTVFLGPVLEEKSAVLACGSVHLV